MSNVPTLVIVLIAVLTPLALLSGWAFYAYGKKKNLPPSRDPATPAPSHEGKQIRSTPTPDGDAPPSNAPASRSPSSS